MKYLAIIGIALLSGCSNFEFHTNVDPSNFKEYFKPSYVTEVSEEELATKPNRSLGIVEGFSCQVTKDSDIATEADARTKARIKAVDKGANAIKFGKCVRIEKSPSCEVSVTCYADALVIDESK